MMDVVLKAKFIASCCCGVWQNFVFAVKLKTHIQTDFRQTNTCIFQIIFRQIVTDKKGTWRGQTVAKTSKMLGTWRGPLTWRPGLDDDDVEVVAAAGQVDDEWHASRR
jgi:hypothetical protein